VRAPALELGPIREAERLARDAFFRGLLPEPRVTVSEWADRNRVLGTRSSREPGPWRTSRFPYLREIMDCLSTTSPVRTLVFCKGSQIGGTEVGNNWIGYVVDHAPGPMMAVLPTGDVNTRKSRQTLDPLFEDTPALAAKVAPRRGRDPGNTTTLKVFPGGMLALATAGSAAQLRTMAIRYLFMDELDAWPPTVEGEGDPEDLALRGTATFTESGKVYKVSTPTIEGRSRIMAAFRQTDRRYFHVPCPHCGERQRIEWRRRNGRPALRWEMGEDEDRLAVAALLRERKREVWLECEHCERKIPESAKAQILEAGVWVPEDPSRGELVRGYHLSALYSPFGFYPWAASVAKHLEARDNPEKLRVWVNQDLGETFKETGDAPDWQLLYERREAYRPGVVPRGGVVLTCGVDVQGDRLEAEVVAWGPDFETWQVDYHVFPVNVETDEEPLREVELLLAREWPHADGGPPLRLGALMVDTGYASQTIYRWLRKYGRNRRVFGLRGRVGTGVPVGQPIPTDVTVGGRRIKRGTVYWPVDTGMLKAELYGWLHGRPPVEGGRFPVGYAHFPQRGPEYFQQLTAEVLIRRTLKSGRLVHDWEKKRERNEALDCRVYNRAAAYMLGIDRWTREDWAAARRVLASRTSPAPAAPPQTAPTQTPKPSAPKPERRPRSSGRYSRWRGPPTT